MTDLSSSDDGGLLDAAPDAIVAITADGTITLVNAQCERLFGYHREELVGRGVEVLVPESLRAEHPEHRRRYLDDRRPRPMGAGTQLSARRRDGTEFPADISLSSIETETGLVVVAAVRDVTDRIRAEAKFRGVLEAAPDAIVGIASTGEITLVNAQAERLFGYSREELAGRPIEILVPEHARTVHPAHRNRYFRHPAPRPMGAGMQLAARRKDGTEFPVEISLSALDTEDGTVVLSAIRNVTDRLEMQAARERLKEQAERERMEARLQQSQRLESLGQLAGGVAHDFNNLLAVMLNYTTFVAEQIAEAAAADPSGVWSDASHDIAQILRAGERATELTHQLLAFGRREVVRPRVTDLNGVIHEVEQLLHRTLGEHIQLHTDLEPAPRLVLVDPGQLEQVLVNLAVNARDAMPEGGTLTIGTANRRLDEAGARTHPPLAPGAHVELRVADTGTGIAPGIAERIFEPFFTTKPKGQGTGLGLATAYGAVTDAGGSIGIESAPGAGTTVRITLPATAEPAEGAADPGAEPPAGRGESVLLVEDEDAVRRVVLRQLDSSGYRVREAASPHEALRLFTAAPQSFDVLLTDVVMPGMPGTQLASRVRDLRPDLPVLFMSGYTTGPAPGGQELPSDGSLLYKPFDRHTLLTALHRVLTAAHHT